MLKSNLKKNNEVTKTRAHNYKFIIKSLKNLLKSNKKKSPKQRFKIKRRKELYQIKQYLTIPNLTLKMKNNINHILKKVGEFGDNHTQNYSHTQNVKMHGGR